MIETTDFQNGRIFEHEGALYQVIWFQHHKPGKGGAVMRCKLRNLRTEAIIERSFKSGTKFQDVDLTRRKKQFLYSDGDQYHFMDTETFEQMGYPKERLGGSALFLTENIRVDVLYLGDEVLTMELPASVALKVTSTVPGVKGDSVSNVMKPATLETGVEIRVPLFVNEGDIVKVDTRTREYVERV